jgi:CO/xanthine dehydrogenase Mo-binding subunit
LPIKADTRQQYRIVGKPTPRIDAVGKVTGKTLYGDDLTFPRLLHAKLVLSPYAHARIRSIDTSRAHQLRGVEAIFTARDLPHRKNPSSRPHTFLAEDEVLFYGQPVAVVLSRDPHIAEEACELVEVEYEELRAMVDPLAAMEEGSPLARLPLGEVSRAEEQAHITTSAEVTEAKGKPSNIASQISFKRGDVAAGLAAADTIVERTWRSGMVHQGYIEPHVTIADYDAAGELSIWTSTQAPFYIASEVAQALGIPESKVRVTATEVGGGFGGKISLAQLFVAALATLVRRPVKLTMTRREDMLAATPAPQAVVELKAGMKLDGTLTAIQARLIFDSGAFPGAPVVPACLLVGGYYKCPNLDIQGYEVLTNKVNVGALRAPGAHNATLAIESAMDILARKLGLDPLMVRMKNAVEKGDPLPSGEPYPAIGLRECLEAIAETDIWKERDQIRAIPNRGVGLATGGWLGGTQPASAIVGLNTDGTINIISGVADITGTNTSFAQIAAEVLNVPLSMVTVTPGDTRSAPYTGVSGGSKITFTMGRAVKKAAEDACDQILAIAAHRLEASPEELEIVDGVVQVPGSDRSLTFKRIGGLSTRFGARYAPVVGRGSIATRRQAPSFTVQVAEVEVDPDAGQAKILRYASAQDAGFAINPLSVEGQIQGGTSQGLGLALCEEMAFDEAGRLLNPNLLDYRLPTTSDLPHIEAIIVEVPSEDGPYGARIVGEPSIAPGGAVIANAIADAIGTHVHEIPITPERVLKALGKVTD